MSVFRSLFEANVHFVVEVTSDGSVSVGLGDDFNGYYDTAILSTWAEVEEWFSTRAVSAPRASHP